MRVQYLIVFLEAVGGEYRCHGFVVGVCVQSLDGAHEAVGVGEMLVQEVEYHVAALFGIARIHRYFAEKVAHLGVFHREGSQAVPKVVEGIEGFRSGACRLVFEAHERAAELDGERQIVADKFFREAEHVACGYARHQRFGKAYVVAGDEAVASEDEACLGVPHHKLQAGRVHQVEFVDVAVLAGASSGGTERYLAQTSDLAHHIGAFTPVHDINLRVSFVGIAQETRLVQFVFYDLRVDWVDYIPDHIVDGESA